MAGCFAYNKDALRCDSPAGHDGPHTLTIEWTDEECWVPGTNEPSVTEYGHPRIVTPLTTPALPTACVLCDHPFHKGKCQQPDGEYACDCAEGIA